MASKHPAVHCAIPQEARDLAGPHDFDYCDAFRVALPASSQLSAEEWARAMFTPRGALARLFAGLWGAATGVESPHEGTRFAYFRVLSPGPGSVVLVGEGERYRIRLVVLASDGRLTLATFVESRRTIWRQLLKAIMVGHRRVAPLLMERAVARKDAQPSLRSEGA
jgi:hypothetical protein